MTTKTLLFVDDEKNYESLIKSCLREEIKALKYEISFARNGEEALKLIASKQPDVLFTELKFTSSPFGGFDLIKKLREDKININIVIISSCGGLDNICESVRYDVLCFVNKPFVVEGLKTLIELVLQKKEAVSSPQSPKNNLDDSDNPNLTITKAARILPTAEKRQLIENIIESLPLEKILFLQETLPDFLATSYLAASERSTIVETLKDKQKSGLIPSDIPLDSFLRVFKRSPKIGGVEYGPYYYIAWRDTDGRSKSKCVGSSDPRIVL